MELGLLRNNSSTRVADDAHALELWNDGVRLFEKRQNATAIAIFERLAEQNYENAANILGQLYEDKGSSEANAVLARQWYEIAIRDENCMDSRLRLAKLLLRSNDADDISDGLAVLDRAVNLGDHRAKILKAFILDAGVHLELDKNLAKKFLIEAANDGYVLAIRRLAFVARREHKYIASIQYFIKAFWTTFQIAKHDKNDMRLWGWSEREA